MEPRTIADRSVDLVALLGCVRRIEIDLHRLKKRLGGVRERAEHGLPADDDELVLCRDVRRGGDHVLEILASHSVSADLLDDAAPLRLGKRPCERRVLP